MEGDREELLAGGMDPASLVRVGDTVRRAPGPSAVRALLEHLETAGYDGAPRHLGLDEQCREVLAFVEGRRPAAALSCVGADRPRTRGRRWTAAPAERRLPRVALATALLSDCSGTEQQTTAADEELHALDARVFDLEQSCGR